MDIKNDVRGFLQRKRAGLYAILLHFADKLEGDAKRGALWSDKTGHARQSIHSGVDIEGDKFILYLSHGMAYGTYLEIGTGIYGPSGKPIKPINKKALYGSGLPHPVKEVKGIKPLPIIKPTVEANKENIIRTVRDYWRD